MYVTQDQFDSRLDLPVSLPLTDLYPNQWLIVSTIQVLSPQSFTLRTLQLHLVANQDPSAGSDGKLVVIPDSSGNCVFPSQQASLVTPGLGLAFVGLYRNFDPLKQPTFQASQESPLVIGDENSAAPVFTLRTAPAATFTSEGPYSFVVANNTSNRLLKLVITGQVRLNLGQL